MVTAHPTLIQNVPGWGHAIRKVECASHVCKCYRGALEKLVKTNSSYKGSGGLTVKMRKRLVSAARCAIRMRSKENNRVQALALLRKDFINGPRHCFGIHTHCSQISAQQSEIYKYSNRQPHSKPHSKPHSNPHRNYQVLQVIPKMEKFMMTMRMISILEVNQNTYNNTVKIKFKFYFHRTIELHKKLN